jgi:hypothetical protein
MATTYERICIEDYAVTAENGDHFEVKRGETVLTGPDKDGECIVFKNYWVRVPTKHFAGERKFT